MWALRWMLLLGPIGLVVVMVRWQAVSTRGQIGGLFAFLYGLGMVFVTHSIAIWAGWWRYGWDVLMLNGIPADIWIGGAVLFGPGLYFSFPNTRPLIICLPIVIGLHGTVFSALEPLVVAGPYWFWGVVFVFVTAHIPAIYLAKWTEADTHLPQRAALLAVMFGAVAFCVLPSIIMHAMGGNWALETRGVWSFVLMVPLAALTCLIGLSAAQMLTLQGGGTAIPLDPTKRLVRTGVYAYVSNPMQLSAAATWIVLGLFLQNLWVAASAGMAWIFVLGMVRWHHRNDLLQRFPTGWPEYRDNVPEWRPRWRPWMPLTATLYLDACTPRHVRFHRWIVARGPVGLEIALGSSPHARYENPADARSFTGFAALCMAMTHINFAYTLLAQILLFLGLNLRGLRGSAPKEISAL